MWCRRLEMCQQDLVPRDAGLARWRRDSVRSAADVARVIGAVTAALRDAGHAEDELFAVHLALREAIINAHKHGHGGGLGHPGGRPLLRGGGRDGGPGGGPGGGVRPGPGA
jgi:hypothetical protein